MYRFKFLLLISFICVGEIVSAQTKKQNSTQHIDLGLTTNCIVGYRTLEYEPDWEFIAVMRNKYEIPGIGFSVGATLDFITAKRFSINTGLAFMNLRYLTKKNNEVLPGLELDYFVKRAWNYYYLTVPYAANINLFTKNQDVKSTHFYLKVGAQFNLFLKGRLRTENYYVDGFSDKDRQTIGENYNKFNFGVLAGFGLKHDFSPKWSLKVEPFINYSFSALKSYSYLEYQHNVGINFQYVCRIK